ncbi:DUF4163 domain-containing protein [Paenibacillus hunanensis]|uniref:PdaC/SigV domain-containing protein n=1 Tax=Paenibacillus hunanensis TaxID=539262 RepID=UPI0020265E47|nr:DUF4163 domain-containing protein [Paenibacillus hunanensis]MCL9663481.1 DUF4163 domain-containing protein [Paenibacillus hunanensis]
MNTSYSLKNTSYLKKTAALVLAATLATAGTIAILPGSTGSAYAATASSKTNPSIVNVQIEGKAISTQGILGPTGKTLVPLKEAAKALGATVTYDTKTRTVIVSKGKQISSYLMYTDGGAKDNLFVTFNSSALGDTFDGQVIKGTTYVEAKALSEPFGYRTVWTKATNTVNFTTAGMNAITITPTKLADSIDNEYTDVSVLYPVISGLDNEAAQTKINAALKAYVDQSIATTKKQIEEAGKPDSPNLQYEVDSGYKVSYNQNGVISFLLYDYGYLGGAHGGETLTGMTFSLKDGKAIKLDDLLKSNASYRQDIKELLQNEIKKQGGAEDGTLDSFNDLSHNSSAYLNNYYLTDRGFTIFFQQYAIAPYAAGTPEFSFTFNQLLKAGTNPLKAYQ